MAVQSLSCPLLQIPKTAQFDLCFAAPGSEASAVVLMCVCFHDSKFGQTTQSTTGDFATNDSLCAPPVADRSNKHVVRGQELLSFNIQMSSKQKHIHMCAPTVQLLPRQTYLC